MLIWDITYGSVKSALNRWEKSDDKKSADGPYKLIRGIQIMFSWFKSFDMEP
jgi:hypothetical protein